MVTGLRMLDAEFRDAEQARAVLEAIGSVKVGYATFSSAVAQLGGDEASSGTAVSRALPALVHGKQVVAIDVPVGAPPKSKLRQYRIGDPSLRFWFRSCPAPGRHGRGRANLAVGRFQRDFASWCGTGRFSAVAGDGQWRSCTRVSATDVAAVAEGRAVVPGAASARLLAICPAGVSDDTGADVVLGDDDLRGAFR